MKRLLIVAATALLLATQGCCALVEAAIDGACAPRCSEPTVVVYSRPRPATVVVVDRPRHSRTVYVSRNNCR